MGREQFLMSEVQPLEMRTSSFWYKWNTLSRSDIEAIACQFLILLTQLS